MTEKLTRTLSGIDNDGMRIVAVAKYDEKYRHFSLTSGHGSDHERILSVFPELAPVARMHLADRSGIPLHAAANGAYFLENGEVEKARHTLIFADDETLTRLAGEIVLSKKKIEDRAAVVTNELKAEIRREYAKEERGFGLREMTRENFKALLKRSVESPSTLTRADRAMEDEFSPRLKKAVGDWRKRYDNAETAGRIQAKSEIQPVRDWVVANKAKYKQLAEEALAVIALPDFVADNYVEPENDKSTYAGFAAHLGLEMSCSQANRQKDGSNKYKITLSNGVMGYTIDYTMGSGHTAPPSLDLVLQSLQGDARAGDEDFDEFCGNFGYDTDSRTAEKIHAACKECKEQLEHLLGNEFDWFMNKVGEDEPVHGRTEDDEPAAPGL